MTEIDLEELMENLMQCRRCGICRNAVYDDMGFDGVCPVWKNSSGFETSFMRGRIQVAIALLEGELEKSSENAESLFTCSLCGNCTEICTAEFNPVESLEKVRAVLSDIPNEVRDSIAEQIMSANNPYEDDNSLKRSWVSELEFEIPTKGEVVYYTGCTAGIRFPEIAIATAKILKAAGVNFAVLEDEPCCGSVVLRTGRRDVAEKNTPSLVESIRKSGAKKIVVSCAGCAKTLRKDLPEIYGVDFPEIQHMVEFINDVISDGKLNLKKQSQEKTVSYHDPCHLGKALGVYDEPRNILTSLPGVSFTEIEPNREASMCCGAGGGLRSYDPKLSKDIAVDRIRAAEKIQADHLVSACPFCESNLLLGAEQAGSKIRIIDIVELVADLIE